MDNAGAGRSNGARGTFRQQRTKLLKDALRQAMEQHNVPKEVQEEALRAVSNAASQAGKVDAAQLEALARCAEARANVCAEALRQAESAEERKFVLDRFLRADERDSQERFHTGERSTDSQRGFAKIAGTVLGVLAVSAGAAAVGAGAVWAATRK